MAQGEKTAKVEVRARLAFIVIGIGMAGITIFAVVAIVYALNGTERAETTRLVFSSVLPLFGTWIGTVLAFYFARENLAAATESTQILAGRTPSLSRPVTAVMRDRADCKVFTLAAGASLSGLELGKVSAEMKSTGVGRIPIIDSSEAVLYVIHMSTLAQFAAKQGATVDTFATTHTLGALLQDTGLAALVKAIAFVPKDAIVADARSALKSIPKCNDVFVTKTGKKDEAMLGWLTNKRLAEIEST